MGRLRRSSPSWTWPRKTLCENVAAVVAAQRRPWGSSLLTKPQGWRRGGSGGLPLRTRPQDGPEVVASVDVATHVEECCRGHG